MPRGTPAPICRAPAPFPTPRCRGSVRPRKEMDRQRRQSQPALASSRLGTAGTNKWNSRPRILLSQLATLLLERPPTHNGLAGSPLVSGKAGRQVEKSNPGIIPCNRKVYAHCDSDIRGLLKSNDFSFLLFLLSQRTSNHRLSISFLHALDSDALMPAPGPLPRSYPPSPLHHLS